MLSNENQEERMSESKHAHQQDRTRENEGEKKIQIAPGPESTYDAAGTLNLINFVRKWITLNSRQKKQTDRKQD